MKAKFVDNLESGKTQHVVTYGTSLTDKGAWVQALADYLKEKYPGLVKVTNSGKSAMWSGWGVENLEERVIREKPDAVIIEFGINDAYVEYKTSLKQSAANLEYMIDRIEENNPECEVILMTMNPPVREHLDVRPRIEEYYQGYRDIAKKRGLMLIDHQLNWNRVLETNPELFDRYVPDGIHPSDEGCLKVIVPEIMKQIFGDA